MIKLSAITLIIFNLFKYSSIYENIAETDWKLGAAESLITIYNTGIPWLGRDTVLIALTVTQPVHPQLQTLCPIPAPLYQLYI